MDKVAVMFLIVLVAAIIVGMVKMSNQNSDVKERCMKTHLYVIGNKGHLTPVYDCSNMNKEQRRE